MGDDQGESGLCDPVHGSESLSFQNMGGENDLRKCFLKKGNQVAKFSLCHLLAAPVRITYSF